MHRPTKQADQSAFSCRKNQRRLCYFYIRLTNYSRRTSNPIDYVREQVMYLLCCENKNKDLIYGMPAIRESIK